MLSKYNEQYPNNILNITNWHRNHTKYTENAYNSVICEELINKQSLSKMYIIDKMLTNYINIGNTLIFFSSN